MKARLGTGPPVEHPSHGIVIAPDSRLAGALGAGATVNSYHHQSIVMLEGVVVVATAPDGVIEAIEVPAADALCVGVQWEVQEEPSSPLLALFVHAAAERAAARHQARAGVGTGADQTRRRTCDITAPSFCTNSSKQR